MVVPMTPIIMVTDSGVTMTSLGRGAKVARSTSAQSGPETKAATG